MSTRCGTGQTTQHDLLQSALRQIPRCGKASHQSGTSENPSRHQATVAHLRAHLPSQGGEAPASLVRTARITAQTTAWSRIRSSGVNGEIRQAGDDRAAVVWVSAGIRRGRHTSEPPETTILDDDDGRGAPLRPFASYESLHRRRQRGFAGSDSYTSFMAFPVSFAQITMAAILGGRSRGQGQGHEKGGRRTLENGDI